MQHNVANETNYNDRLGSQESFFRVHYASEPTGRRFSGPKFFSDMRIPRRDLLAVTELINPDM